MPATLVTERLVLRPLEPSDLAELTVLHAEPSFWQYPLRRGQTAIETATFLDRVIAGYGDSDLGFEAVVERRRGVLVGWAGLSVPTFLPEILPAVEVGWRLGSSWRGQGYATEAGAAALRWGYEGLRLDHVVSIYEPANRASGRVMAKLGLELERVTRHPANDVELHVTGLSRDRWSRRRDGH